MMILNNVNIPSSNFCYSPHPQLQQKKHGDFRPTFYNPFEIKHRRRTSRAQLKVLEEFFEENAKPNSTTRRMLAQKLDMAPRGVQTWFQNRRAKAKLQRRKASATVPVALKQGQHYRNNNNSFTRIPVAGMATSPKYPHRHSVDLLPEFFPIPPSSFDTSHTCKDLCASNTMENTQSVVSAAAPTATTATITTETPPMDVFVRLPYWLQQQQQYPQQDARRHSCSAAITTYDQPEEEDLSHYYYMLATAIPTTNDGSGVMPLQRQPESDVQNFNMYFSIEDLGLDYTSRSTVSAAGSPILLDYLTTAYSDAQDSSFLMYDLF